MQFPKVLGGRMASCSGGAGILPAVFLCSTLRENRRRGAGATTSHSQTFWTAYIRAAAFIEPAEAMDIARNTNSNRCAD
jgi:hypothetical protein